MMLGHNRKMLGAECMADMLEAYGVTHVFHVPAVLRKTFAVMESRTKIKRLHVHSEATAAYMADGYARASGKPGICMAQVLGALNLAAGLRDAWLAHSPVIAFTGGSEPKTKFRHVYQEVDDVPAFEPVTKWNATVDDVNRFPDMVRQAFRAATTGTPGPVHLQLRGNEGQVDGEQGGERGRSHLLCRLDDRRHDHALLGCAQNWHASNPDRYRSRGARPELSAADSRQRRCQSDAFEDAGGLRQVHRRQAQGLGRT